MVVAPQPLSSVAVGTQATVAEIRLPPESRPRLMEMGLLVGTPVELVRFAPLGDPVEIKVRGYNLTIRKSEAEQILVKVMGDPPSPGGFRLHPGYGGQDVAAGK